MRKFVLQEGERWERSGRGEDVLGHGDKVDLVSVHETLVVSVRRR
jgi:hypothetical protein